MTNQEIVYSLSYSGLVEDIARNIRVTSDYYDDFVQETYVTLLEYDNTKLNEIFDKKQIKYFVVRIMLNNWNSTTSPFYTKYKKYLEHIDMNADLNGLSDRV